MLLCGLLIAVRAQFGVGGAVLLGWMSVSALASAAPVFAVVPMLIGVVSVGSFALARSLDDAGRNDVRWAIVWSGVIAACLVLAEARGGLRAFMQDG